MSEITKNVTQLFSWVNDMLEGTDMDEPMTLAQVVTRLTLRDMMERGEEDEDAEGVDKMVIIKKKVFLTYYGTPLKLIGVYERPEKKPRVSK